MTSHHEAPGSGVIRLIAGGVKLTWQADRRGFGIGATMQVIGALAPTALVLVGQLLLNSITAAPNDRPHVGSLIGPVIALAIATAFSSATTLLQQQQQRLLGERVAARAWQRVLDVTARVKLARYESAEFFDQVQRIKTNALSQPVNVTNSLFGLIGGSVGVVSLLIVLVAIQPILVPTLLLVGVPSILLSRRTGALEHRFLVRGTPIFRGRQYLRDILTGRDQAKEIRVFEAAPALRIRHDERGRQYDELLRRHTRTRQLYALVQVAVVAASLAFTLGLVVWLLSTNRLSLAQAAAAVLAVRFLSTALDQMFRSVGGLIESSVYLADLNAFVALGVTAEKPSSGVDVPLEKGISVRGVTFTYPESAREVLHGIDLDIGAREIVALVGENGSGKTTLAKMIAALYEPTQGTICWDGQDTAEFEPADVRRQVSVIFQDFVRYQLTAWENIGLGYPDQIDDLAGVRAAAHAAGADEILAALPYGLDTILSKEFANGADLSMGQWQRVALARALRKPARLVVLDEPSASLDPRSEAQLFEDIRAMLGDRSALLISHRFSSVRLADRIYVLVSGRVSESGTHDELMALDGTYADLFRLQARAYE